MVEYCSLGGAIIIAIGCYVIYKIIDAAYRKPRVGNYGDRYILVTGCDTGFGNEISKRLDKYGCHVFAGCLTEKGETELKKATSERLVTVPLDVANPASIRKAFETVKSKLPKGKGLWGVLNNAGIAGKIGPVEWLTKKDYEDVFNVNLHGLIDVTVTFLPLVKIGKGRIINTASVFGRTSLAGSTPYCISKYGVEAFSDALRRQLYAYGVGVSLIEPGFHKTNITNTDNLTKSLKASFDQAPKEIQDEYGEEFLTGSIESVLKQFVSGVISEKIQDVVDAYDHALLAKNPRARYVVGFDAKYIWLPVQWSPEWLGDKFLDLAAKDRPIPAALKKK